MAKSYATTYCDGDQLGCTWAGAAHASTSSRSAQYRGGGRVRDFLDDYSVGVVAMQGWGMPEVKPATIDYATLPGGLIQHLKTGMRQWQLVFEAASPTLSAIHTARDYLIEAFKPDRVSPVQPVRLQYHGTTTPVEIDAWYVGGLEGSLIGREGVVESPVARLLSEDPMWYGVVRDAVVLTQTLSVANANYAIKQRSGVWSALVSGAGSSILRLAQGTSGSIYLAGQFTDLGDANGDYIVQYNPVTNAWSSLGLGLDQSAQAICLASDGSIYVGGTFTSAGGVANTSKIARWDGSSWSALGTGGANFIVYDIVFDQSGTLYACGSFLAMGGVANTAYIAQWSGTAWAAVSSGLGAEAYTLAVGLDGAVYVGGNFTNQGDANGDYIVKWTGSAWQSLGTGANGAVRKILVADDGMLYAFGAFTTIGGVTANRAARWNGISWAALGSGLNQLVYTAALDSTGQIIVGGTFTTAGGLTLGDYIAVWNGSSWVHLGADLPGAANVNAILITATDDVYLGYSTNGTATTAKTTTVTNNGSRTAYPKFKVTRSGGTTARVEYVKNETTDDTIYLNYSLLAGETLTIDLDYQRDPTTGEAKTSGRKRITSSFFGNVIGRALLPGSDFAAFGLAPGSNTISLYVYEAGAPTVTAWAEWREPYWSVDGAVS